MLGRYGAAGTGPTHTLLRHSLSGHATLLLVLLLRRLAHVLLVLGSSTRRRGQLGAQVLVLAQ